MKKPTEKSPQPPHPAAAFLLRALQYPEIPTEALIHTDSLTPLTCRLVTPQQGTVARQVLGESTLTRRGHPSLHCVTTQHWGKVFPKHC